MQTTTNPTPMRTTVPRPTCLAEYGVPVVPINHGGQWASNCGMAIPSIGDLVCVTTNELGPGVVVSYFRERRWLGVQVRLFRDPPWHARQCARDWYAGSALALGTEIRPLTVEERKAVSR